jgi:hypothetical protein
VSDQVIPFPGHIDPLDRAGQEVISKLQRAASIAEQNTQHAVALAHQASMQLRVAEDKILRLEYELSSYKERAERAEAWLQRISQEIEQSFASRQTDPYGPRRLSSGR